MLLPFRAGLLIILLAITINNYAQTTDSLVINSITFEGLKKTKTTLLSSFLSNRIGTTTNAALLQSDAQQLSNLDIVAFAQYHVDTTEQGLDIRYEVKEAFSLFPNINFGGIRGNFWYEVGITDFNFLGKGAQLTANYRNNDGRHNFNLYYKMPYLNNPRWGFSASLLKWASIEPLYFDPDQIFYDYDNWTVGATLIHHFSNIHHIEFGGSYFIESYQKNSRHAEEITPGPEAATRRKALAKAIYRFGQLNYHYYEINGFNNILNVQSVYDFDDHTPFFILINDSHFFQRTDMKGNFAARLRIGLSSNNDSPFAPFVLDSNINIRGSGNRIDRGTAAIILNLEYRQTIFDRKAFAAQAVGFSDTGTWRNPGGELSDLVDGANFRHFIGGGFRFIYKNAYNAIVRLDYGIDLYNFNERGFVIGLGQYF
jgi:outer membrane protein assembly factor BamA